MFQFERDVDKHAFDASSKVHSDNKVIGNTGEGKHEEIFFKKRGKLFYFYAGQWKEKGVGYIQIIFYRRLKTAFLKITKQNCTHLMVPTYYVYQRISSCMKIHPFQKSDKAFSWFAENELRYEHLCICFKTVDIAAAFKAAFEKVLNILKENKIGNITNPVIKSTTDTYPVTQQPYGTRSLPKADSWTCPVCYTNNAADKLVCVACQAKKPGSQATSASNSITTITSSTKSNANLFTFNMNAACSVSSPKSTFSGFTFWPSAVLKEVKPASTSIPIASSSGNSTANQFTLGENSAVFASVINQNNMFDGLTFSTVPMIKDKKTVSPSISVATSTSNSTANLFSFNQNSAVISSVSEQRNISQGLTFFTGRRIKKTKTDTKARGTLVASTKSEKCQASSYFGFSCVSSHSTAVTSSLAGLKPVCHYDRNQSVITTGRSAASTENNISKMNSVLPNISFVNTLYSRSSESFATFSNYNVCASNCASSSNVSAYSLPSHNNVSTEDQKMSTNIINDFAYKFATAAEVKPIVSLPALVEVKSSEDEKELFGEQAKLLRFDFDEKEWKKYCTGELKILYLKARKMGRISMRTGKLCTNQYIFPHMQLTPLANNNEAWIWYAEDVSDGELKKEMFAAKFKSTEIAQEFLKTFHACQSKLDEITEEKKLHLDDKFQPGAYMGNKKIFDEQPSTCTEKASPGLLGTIKHSSVGFPSEIKPLTQSTALPFFGLSSVAEASATAGFKSVFPANNAARGGLTQKSEISEIKSVPIPLATDSFESSASLSKFNVDLSASSKKSDASLFGSIERPKGCEFNFKGSLYGNAKTLMASIPTPSCIDDDDEEDEEDSFDKCLPPDVPLPPEADDNFLNEIEEVTFYGPGILFSFSDGDWKKQGIGNIKICVYRLTKKAPRLLMQEEGVSNLCADHYFTSNMELHGLKNSERVFFWLAVVHTVEGMRLQNLCVCFRTINIAAAFKTAFEEALKIAKENEAEVKSTTNASPVTQKPFGVTFLPKASSWTCQTCYVSNAADKLLCVACETKKRGSQVTAGSNSISVSTSITNSTANQFTFSINSFSQRFKVTSVSGSKNTLGVSTFSASPVMPEKKSVIKSRAMLFAVRKKYEKTCCITEVTAPKPWPFSGFSFKSPPTAVVSSSSTVQFIESTESAKARVENNISKIHSMLQTITPDDMFGSKSAESVATFPNFSISVSKSSAELTVPTSSAPLFVNVSAEGRRVSIDAADGAPEEFVRTAEFKPIVPLPALVDVKTVGEGEEKLFGERAELFRFDREGKEWKEWGIGELKILFLTDSKKYKILMRREQVLKIGANHYILPDMKLTPLATNDKAWVWFAQDFSDGDLKKEQFAAKFKTKEIAQEFFEVFQKCQNDLKEIADKNEKPQIAKSQSDTCTGNKTAFDELFKPVGSSWKCSKCQKSNMNESSCVYCSTPKSGISVVTGKSSLVSEQKPLSELFKPDKNSWECQACYVRSKSCDVKCVSCESPQQSSSDTFNKNAISNNQNTEPISYVKNGKSEPLTNLFKPPAGSWQCQSCLIQYNADVDKCAACETKKPGSSFASSAFPSSSDFGKFQFGSSVQSTSSTEKTSPFSFGSNKPSSGDFLFGMKPITQSTTFSFGLSSVIGKGSETVGFKPTLPTSNTPAVFGGTTQKSDLLEKKSITIPQTTSAPTDAFGNTSSTSIFSFGSPAGKEADSSFVEFRFGSPQKYEFNFSGVRPRSPTKTPKSPKSPATPSDVDEDDEGDSFDADNIYFQPAIPLPPKVDVKTGEENEDVMFCKRAKLFRFSAGEWKERGVGDVKILFDKNLKKARLLMRRDQVLKVCLNHHLTKEIVFEWRGEKSLTWAATDFSENEASPELFAIRFKSSELAQEFKDALDDALKLNALASESEVSSEQTSTATKVITNFSFKSDSSVKTESPFSAGSLSACFGTTLQGKSLFGNSANVLGTTETKPSSSVSPFFQTDKLGTNSVFGQNVNFSTNSSKSIFGGHGLKFGLGSDALDKKKIDKDCEIEIVYEATASPDKITEAEKLKLPRNFYLYESKPPCKGCRGCTDTISYKDVSADVEKNSAPKFTELTQSTPQSENSGELFATSAKSVTFADLATDSSFESLAKPSSTKNAFAGAGTPLFSNPNNSTEDAGDDETVSQGPDIHFEPVIPLPELVDVKTGEEDETPVFIKRAKLFRFDSATKQWKERGVGDLKILKHKEKQKFRIILRRDQVHKIACNHFISEDMSLVPMATSETALCWNAIDYADGSPVASKFAVRFKNKDFLEEFREKFNECIELIKHTHKSTEASTEQKSEGKDVTESQVSNCTKQNAEKTEISQKTSNQLETQSNHVAPESENNEHNSDEESEEDDFIFEKRVSFEIFDESSNQFKPAGMGTLQMLYDDTVYGYRILMMDDKDNCLCENVIAIQTCLRVEGKKASWTAIDLSVEPPKRRQFRATFSSLEAVDEFNKQFAEGKELAVNSEIVEKSDDYLTATSGV